MRETKVARIHLYEAFRTGKFVETKDLEIPRTERGSKKELLSNEWHFYLRWQNALRMENGDGCTILWVHLLNASKLHTFLQLILCAPVCVRVHACMSPCTCGHQRRTSGNWFSPSTRHWFQTLITDRQQTLTSWAILLPQIVRFKCFKW